MSPKTKSIEIIELNSGAFAFETIHPELISWVCPMGKYQKFKYWPPRFTVISLPRTGDRQKLAIDSAVFMTGNAVNAVHGVHIKGLTKGDAKKFRKLTRNSLLLHSVEPLQHGMK